MKLTFKKDITTIGVTGTKGKSTTTAMMHAALTAVTPEHTTVALGGNIGIPPLDLLKHLEPKSEAFTEKYGFFGEKLKTEKEKEEEIEEAVLMDE